MEIIQVVTITLEDEEMSALQTLKSAHDQCYMDECFECKNCPLYVKDTCIGQYAEIVLDRQKDRSNHVQK